MGKSPGDPTPYGGQLSMTGSIGTLIHVYPGSYDVQVSAHDAQGTTYNYSGTVAVPGCDNAFAGIQSEPNPDGGYLTVHRQCCRVVPRTKPCIRQAELPHQ